MNNKVASIGNFVSEEASKKMTRLVEKLRWKCMLCFFFSREVWTNSNSSWVRNKMGI